MTEALKQLVIRDICSRLPYGLKVEISFADRKYIERVQSIGPFKGRIEFGNYGIPLFPENDTYSVKPILYEVSDFTEDELERFGYNQLFLKGVLIYREGYATWMNSHMADWRGLIPLGLAVSAKTLENNPYPILPPLV